MSVSVSESLALKALIVVLREGPGCRAVHLLLALPSDLLLLGLRVAHLCVLVVHRAMVVALVVDCSERSGACLIDWSGLVRNLEVLRVGRS